MYQKWNETEQDMWNDNVIQVYWKNSYIGSTSAERNAVEPTVTAISFSDYKKGVLL